MRAIVGRLGAVVAATIVTFLAGTLGLEVTIESQAQIAEGITLLGMALFTALYATVHKIINRWLAPADTAAPVDELPTVTQRKLG